MPASRHIGFSMQASRSARARGAIPAFFVSGSYFSVLGLRPALGRLLGTEDDRVDGQAESVVLSYAYWQRELAGASDVLGRKLTVNGAPLTIVGVAPRGFHGTTVGARASVFVPITFRGVGTGTVDTESRQPRLLLGLSVRASSCGNRGADGGERDQSALPSDLERDRRASDHPRRGGVESKPSVGNPSCSSPVRARAERATSRRSGRRSRCCSPSAAPCCSFAAPTSPAWC